MAKKNKGKRPNRQSSHDIEDFKNWGMGKPLFLVGLAKQIVTASNDIIDLFKMLRDDHRGKVLASRPNLDEWLSLYRDHRRVGKFISNLGMGTLNDGTTPQGLWYNDIFYSIRKSCDDLAKMEGAERAAYLKEFYIDWQSIPEEHRRALVDFIYLYAQGIDDQGRLFDDEDPIGLNVETFRSPEMQYVLCVHWPCWIKYKKLPIQLLEAARQDTAEGLAAFQALVAIDKSIVHEWRIRENLHKLEAAGNAKRRRLYALAQLKPFPAVDRQEVKVTLASYISWMFRKIRSNVTIEEIRALFDHAIKVKKGSQARIDSDLPDIEAFRKNIRRKYSLWDGLLNGTKARVLMSH